MLNYYDWFDASLQNILAASGETAFSKAQSAVFVNLAEGRNTAVDIARHLGVSKQAGNKTVNELVERGLLTLVVDAEDKRSKRILPTRAGLEKGRQAAKALHELESDCYQRHLTNFKHYFDRLIGGSYFSTPSTPRLYSTPWVVARCAIGQESPNRIAELKMRRGTRRHGCPDS